MSFDELSCEFGKIPVIDWAEWMRKVQAMELTKLTSLTCYLDHCRESFDCVYNLKKHQEIVHP